MYEAYTIYLDEDEITRDEVGNIVRHPFIGPYKMLGKGKDSSAHFIFAASDLMHSTLLDDVKVFHLMFYGDPNHSGREAWADPLRVKVLQRLSKAGRSWYFGFLENSNLDGPDKTGNYSFRTELPPTSLKNQTLNNVILESNQRLGAEQSRTSPKLFIEAPNELISEVVEFYWNWVVPGARTEGYNMASGGIDKLRKWNKRPRTDQLFREIIDDVFITFYCFPTEDMHFVFYTNKLSFEEMRQLLDIDDLEESARKIGNSIEHKNS